MSNQSLALRSENDTYRLSVFYDDDAPNPRKEWDNVGTMVCWHRRYDLGDKDAPNTPEAFWNELLYGLEKEKDDTIDKVVGGWPQERLKKEYIYGWTPENDNEDDNLTDEDVMDLMDEISDRDLEDMPEDVREAVIKLIKERFIILSIYMYDHGGIGLSTSNSNYPFNCPWDSGQVGYIYVSNEKAKQEWSGDDWREKAIKYLEGEVEVYSQYLNGECYGFVLEKGHVCEACGHEEYEIVDSCWGFLGYDRDELKQAILESIDEEHKELVDALQYV